MQLLNYCWATEIIELCNGNFIQQGQRGRLLILLSGRNYNFKFCVVDSVDEQKKLEFKYNIHLLSFYFHGKSCAAIESLKYWVVSELLEMLEEKLNFLLLLSAWMRIIEFKLNNIR